MRLRSSTIEVFKPCLTDTGDIIPDYEVSNYGRVLSLRRGIILRPYLVGGRKGSRYHVVCLWQGQGVKRTQVLVHRLVAKAFICLPPTPAHEINHKDGDKRNNRVDEFGNGNLEWVTHAENIAHSVSTGLHGTGARKVTDEQREAIRKSNKTLKALSAEYGLHMSTVFRIRKAA
ncbi:MAG: HNH endonuclease signature motif containing protein [Bryobacteraceae bacterium]